MELKEKLRQAKEEGFIVEFTTDLDIQGHWTVRTFDEYYLAYFRRKSSIARWLLKRELL